MKPFTTLQVLPTIFIHLFNKYLWACFVCQAQFLGTWNTTVNRVDTEQTSAIMEFMDFSSPYLSVKECWANDDLWDILKRAVFGTHLINITFWGLGTWNFLWPSCILSAKEPPQVQTGAREHEVGGNQRFFCRGASKKLPRATSFS